MANGLLFIIAQLMHDNSIVDVAWGILFVIPNLILLAVNKNWHGRTILTFCLVTVWAVRLAIHILMRKTKEEDYRY
jgi:steroid 5-alpha reductase family enzyme